MRSFKWWNRITIQTIRCSGRIQMFRSRYNGGLSWMFSIISEFTIRIRFRWFHRMSAYILKTIPIQLPWSLLSYTLDQRSSTSKWNIPTSVSNCMINDGLTPCARITKSSGFGSLASVLSSISISSCKMLSWLPVNYKLFPSNFDIPNKCGPRHEFVFVLLIVYRFFVSNGKHGLFVCSDINESKKIISMASFNCIHRIKRIFFFFCFFLSKLN